MSASPLTKEALAGIIDKLLASREEQAAAAARRPAPRAASPGAYPGMGPASPRGAGAGAASDDAALWEEATAMLRGELIRLGREAAAKMEASRAARCWARRPPLRPAAARCWRPARRAVGGGACCALHSFNHPRLRRGQPLPSRPCPHLLQENERLRSEVGELKTARFSAEAMAARLEEMNALSIRVSGVEADDQCASFGGWWMLDLAWGRRTRCPSGRAAGAGTSVRLLARRKPKPSSWSRFARPRPAGPLPSARTHSPTLTHPLQVASLKLELAALKAEQDEREDALLGQVRGRGGWC